MPVSLEDIGEFNEFNAEKNPFWTNKPYFESNFYFLISVNSFW